MLGLQLCPIPGNGDLGQAAGPLLASTSQCLRGWGAWVKPWREFLVLLVHIHGGRGSLS